MTIKCLCAVGYELQSDYRTCQKPSHSLLFSYFSTNNNSTENSGLFRTSLSSKQSFNFEQIQLINIFKKFNNFPTAIAIDPVYFYKHNNFY